jgi:hypothetical protein
MNHNDVLRSFYERFIPFRDIRNIGRDEFCLYFTDPSHFLKNIDFCKFKKVVIHWTEAHLELLDKFVDISYVYHVISDPHMSRVFTEKNIKNVKLVSSSKDLENYLLEEEYQGEA